MSAQQPKYDSQDRVKANLLTTAKTLDVHDLIAENKYRAPHFDLGYITPVDRIASYYTRGLTMKHANTLGGRVKDATIRSGRMSPRMVLMQPPKNLETAESHLARCCMCQSAI